MDLPGFDAVMFLGRLMISVLIEKAVESHGEAILGRLGNGVGESLFPPVLTSDQSRC